MAKVKANTDGFKKMLKNLKNDYTLRVGIIGSDAKAEHNGDGLTNAEIGTFHELSKKHRRSFLEDPLKEKLNFKNEKMKPLKKSLWKNLFQKNNPKEFYKVLGAEALAIIAQAFNSNGFGRWSSLTAAYAKRKAKDNYNANQILTATSALRNTISSKVIKKQK